MNAAINLTDHKLLNGLEISKYQYCFLSEVHRSIRK